MTYTEWAWSVQCGRKRQYQSRAAARRARRSAAARYHEPTSAWCAYRCPHGDHLHIGHARRTT